MFWALAIGMLVEKWEQTLWCWEWELGPSGGQKTELKSRQIQYLLGSGLMICPKYVIMIFDVTRESIIGHTFSYDGAWPAYYLNWVMACYWNPWQQHSMKFTSKYNSLHQRKCISRCRLQKGNHFVSYFSYWRVISEERYDRFLPHSSLSPHRTWFSVNSLRPSDAYMHQ